MHFEKEGIYHIFNQGNNRARVFFSEKNYLFFIEKIREYILPYSDILAWCLLPNHFHLMVFVRETTHGVTQQQTHGVTQSHTVSKPRSFNESIGIMLRSYTRAINKEQNRSGALFREGTKAICLNRVEGISPAWYTINGVTAINMQNPEYQYPQVCFDYIHFNPVKHGIVDDPGDWEYSSCREHLKSIGNSLINSERTGSIGLTSPGE